MVAVRRKNAVIVLRRRRRRSVAKIKKSCLPFCSTREWAGIMMHIKILRLDAHRLKA